MTTKGQQIVLDAHDLAVERIEFSTDELLRYSDDITEKQYQTVLKTLRGLVEDGYLERASWTTWAVDGKWADTCLGGKQ